MRLFIFSLESRARGAGTLKRESVRWKGGCQNTMFTAKNLDIADRTSKAEELDLIYDDDGFIPAFGKSSGDNHVERYFYVPPRLPLHHHQKSFNFIAVKFGSKTLNQKSINQLNCHSPCHKSSVF